MTERQNGTVAGTDEGGARSQRPFGSSPADAERDWLLDLFAWFSSEPAESTDLTALLVSRRQRWMKGQERRANLRPGGGTP